MFAALSLEASQSVEGRSFRLRVFCGINPQIASWLFWFH